MNESTDNNSNINKVLNKTGEVFQRDGASGFGRGGKILKEVIISYQRTTKKKQAQTLKSSKFSNINPSK